MMKPTVRDSLFFGVVLLLAASCGEAFFFAPGPAVFKPRVSLTTTATNVNAVRHGGGQQDPELSVFDAGETGVSWEDYKKQKPDEFKVCPKRIEK